MNYDIFTHHILKKIIYKNTYFRLKNFHVSFLKELQVKYRKRSEEG